MFDLPTQPARANDGSSPMPKPKRGSGKDERTIRNPQPVKAKPAPRKGIARNVDREVYLRAKGKCERCGKGPKEAPLHIHHVKPHAKGGEDDFDNYALLCSDCNGALGASTEWKPDRERIDGNKIVSQLAAIVGKKSKLARAKKGRE